MRYPEDLFKVQRNMLAQYHVTDAADVLRRRRPVEGARGPGEPQANKQPPYRLSVRTPGNGDTPVFSLTSMFVPQKRQNLASFISVDADASRPDYGTIRILRLPSNTQRARTLADREQLRRRTRTSRTSWSPSPRPTPGRSTATC